MEFKFPLEIRKVKPQNKNVKKNGIFSVGAPQYFLRPPVTEHVPLDSKSLCKNNSRASGGCK